MLPWVGGVDDQGTKNTLDDGVASWSSRGTTQDGYAKPDVLAPGAPVTSAGMGGGLSTFLGTSQACPVAAATAALLLQAHPGLSPDQIEAALKNTGVTVTDPKNGLQFRRIDAKAAVDSVR